MTFFSVDKDDQLSTDKIQEMIELVTVDIESVRPSLGPIQKLRGCSGPSFLSYIRGKERERAWCDSRSAIPIS